MLDDDTHDGTTKATQRTTRWRSLRTRIITAFLAVGLTLGLGVGALTGFAPRAASAQELSAGTPTDAAEATTSPRRPDAPRKPCVRPSLRRRLREQSSRSRSRVTTPDVP